MKMKSCPADKFIEELKGRKVICFGAGVTLKEAELEPHKKIADLENHIAYFVDNSQSKHGTKYRYCDRDFEVKSPDVLREVKATEYVLVITCDFYVEIYQQLKNIPELQDLDCYVYKAVYRSLDIDMERFFGQEIEKSPYKEWRRILSDLHLKDKHRGERCFVIGNGPSLKAEDLELLKDEITFAVNEIFMIFDKTSWRPTYYFYTDTDGYRAEHEIVSQLPAVMKVIPLEIALMAGKIYGEMIYCNAALQSAMVAQDSIVVSNDLKFSEDIEEIVYYGYTVLYVVLQFAVYMGFSEIYLLGVDHNYKYEKLEDGRIIENDVESSHFDNRIDEQFDDLFKQGALVYGKTRVYEKAKEVCEQKGIIIRNATRGGKLEVFDRVRLEDLFEETAK